MCIHFYFSLNNVVGFMMRVWRLALLTPCRLKLDKRPSIGGVAIIVGEVEALPIIKVKS